MTDNYEIYLSYESEKDNLSDSLIFLSKVVANYSKADAILLNTLSDKTVSSKIVLSNIKYDSLTLFIKNIISNTNKDQIRDKGLKAYWHQFLIEAKEPFLKYMSNHKKLESRKDLLKIKDDIAKIATKNNLDSIPIQGLSDNQMLGCMEAYVVPIESLGASQTYKAKCNNKEYEVNKDFVINKELLDGKEDIFKNQELYVIPKKLCYSGDSMWEFYKINGTEKILIKAKITDKNWLKKFQENDLTKEQYPFPKTTIRVIADISLKTEASGEKKEPIFEFKKIYGPVSPDPLSINNQSWLVK